jgi:alcohol dehydrogenase class IV
MRFEFFTPARIVFGRGAFAELGTLAAPMGKRAFVVKSPSARDPRSILASAGVESVLFPITGEPTVDSVRQGLAAARAGDCGLVIGLGGGSAMDAAKAVAALLTNDGDPLDFLEVIGRGKPIRTPSAPCIAIPTTSGTGAEVTRNAVLASPGHRVKVSMRSPFMTPTLALVDPELTLGLPAPATANTGMDALTQLIEPFVCTRANPLTDALCREGIVRAARSLRAAWADGSNLDAREDLSVASLFGGLALANAGLGAVHGFAAPLGGMFQAPHGAICAALLPHVVSANARAVAGRDARLAERFNEMANLLTGNPSATVGNAVEWLRQLTTDLAIPGLSRWGMTTGDIPAVVAAAEKASSMKANPVRLTTAELAAILEAAL